MQYLHDNDEEEEYESENEEDIQKEIDKHYNRLEGLEKQFMNSDLADSYQPDESVWDRVK